MDGLGGGVGGYVMVFGGEGLEGEGELEWGDMGWGWELLMICKDLRGRGGIGGGCSVVKRGSMKWNFRVEGESLRSELKMDVGWV